MIDTTAEASTTTTDAGEPKTTDGVTAVDTTTAPADTAAPDAKATAPEAPESYEFTMPEGVAVDKTAADEFTAIAKELKLNQADAQKVADVGVKMAQRQAEAHAQLVESWVESVKADKEIGGDKLAENLAVARKAIEAFGTPELKDVLNSTGFGNHPAVIKAFYKAGMAISEDRFVSGSPKGPETDMAKKMFPNMN
jgi:hypothetical protein